MTKRLRLAKVGRSVVSLVFLHKGERIRRVYGAETHLMYLDQKVESMALRFVSQLSTAFYKTEKEVDLYEFSKI